MPPPGLNGEKHNLPKIQRAPDTGPGHGKPAKMAVSDDPSL